GVPGVSEYHVIISDTSDDESLARMAKQATLIINAVGPFRLHGEPVVKAAVENGANYIDVSGEPAYLEKVEMKYARQTRENGVYVVGACGWDSIPCDLGTDLLKRNFDGTLGYVEAFVKNNFEASGYSYSSTSYYTLMDSLSSTEEDNLGQMRRSIMPDRLPKTKFKVPERGLLWKLKENSLQGWILPFPGADKSIVQRSQYYDYHVNGKRPFQISTYIAFESLSNALLLGGWMTAFGMLSKFSTMRKLLESYPEQCSFNMFKDSGPTKQQMEESHFEYFFFGRGWYDGDNVDELNPNKKALVVCSGPDLGYIGTSGCIASAALALLDDADKLPKQGGVYTTASAFRDTHILDYLKSFGITFELIHEKEKSKM
ncbi:hypothetical protein PENTCL1PPCAC_16984, partial [Pristionchus entomophagus]